MAEGPANPVLTLARRHVLEAETELHNTMAEGRARFPCDYCGEDKMVGWDCKQTERIGMMPYVLRPVAEKGCQVAAHKLRLIAARVVLQAARRRLLRVSKGETPIPRATRRLMESTFAAGQPCSICGVAIEAFEKREIHHIVAQARGGTHELSNLAWAHAACNQRVADRL